MRMADTFDTLTNNVLGKVRQQRERAQGFEKARPPTLLGALIGAALKSRKMSTEAFAAKLGVEKELAEAILDGDLPASEVDDGLLEDVAGIIEHEPNELRLLLGRAITPTREPDTIERPAAQAKRA